MLPPARPPFFLASVGLCGLRCEGNGRLSPWRRCLGPSRFRAVFPAGGRMVEASSVLWNKVLRPFLCLVVIRSGAGDGLVRLGFVGFEDQVGTPDLGGPCTGVRLLSSLVLLLLFLMFMEAGLAVSGLWRFTSCGVVEVWVGVARSKGPTANNLCRHGWKRSMGGGRRHSKSLVVIFFLLRVLSIKIGCTVFSLI